MNCSPFVPLVHKPGYGAIVIQASDEIVPVFLKSPSVFDPPSSTTSERVWHVFRQRPVASIMVTLVLVVVGLIWWGVATARSSNSRTSVPSVAAAPRASSPPVVPQTRQGSAQRRQQTPPLSTARIDEEARQRQDFVKARLARSGQLATGSAVREGVRQLENRMGLPRPLTGWMSGRQDGEAPLSVKCRTDTMIVLEDKYSGRVVATYFCRAGQTLETEVPLGTYRLKYGSGDVWYGPVLAFGPGTSESFASYAEADSDLVFRVSGNYVEGHRIELIMQARGNLSTDPIPVSDF